MDLLSKNRDVKIKQSLSNWYFSIARNCPEWIAQGIPGIKRLRTSLEHRDSKALSRSKLVEALDLKQIYFFEIFHPDDYLDLEQGVEKLLKKTKTSTIHKTAHEKFFDNIHQPKRGNLQHFCTVVSDNAKDSYGIPPGPYFYEEFSEHIGYIELSLFQIIPSMVVTLVKVDLLPEVNEDLENVLTKNYKSKMRLASVKPWKLRATSIKSYPPLRIRIECVNNLFENLQVEVEEYLRDFISGSFLRDHSKDKATCPSWRVYLAKENTPVIKSLSSQEYRDKYSNLLEALSLRGFNIHSDFAYAGDNYFLFISSQRKNRQSQYMKKSIIGFPNLWRSEDIEMYANAELASLDSISSFFKGHISYLAIWDYLTILTTNLSEYRQRYFKSFRDSSSKKLSTFNRNFIRLSTQLEEIERDFNYYSNSLKFDVSTWRHEVNTLNGSSSTQIDSTLSDKLESRIPQRLEKLKSILMTSQKIIESELSIKNLVESKSIRLIMIFLTTVLIWLNLVEFLSLTGCALIFSFPFIFLSTLVIIKFFSRV